MYHHYTAQSRSVSFSVVGAMFTLEFITTLCTVLCTMLCSFCVCYLVFVSQVMGYVCYFPVMLQLWDNGRIERFQSVRGSFFHGCYVNWG